MPVLSIGEKKYMILYIKQISYNCFLRNFQAILGRFRGNSDRDWGRFSAPNRVQKNTDSCHWKLKFCNYIMINIGLVLARSIISPFLFSVWLQEKGVYCTKLKASVSMTSL